MDHTLAASGANWGPLTGPTAEPSRWYQVVVKESTVFTEAPSKENGQLVLKRPKFLVSLREVFFKATFGVKLQGVSFL